MKNRIRVISLALSAVMTVTMFSSCGNNGSSAELENEVTTSASMSAAVSKPSEPAKPTKPKETEKTTAVTTSVPETSETTAEHIPETTAPASTETTTAAVNETTVTTTVTSLTEETEISQTTAREETVPPETTTSETFSEQVFTHSTDISETEVTEEDHTSFVAGDYGDSALRPYSYRFLNEKQLYVYDAIITAVQQKRTKVRFSALMEVTDKDYCDVYQMIYNDECSMFYLGTNMQYAINSSTRIVSSANLFYRYSDETIDSMKAEIEAEADRVIAQIKPDMTEYDVVKLFYDYLATNVIYDDNEGENCRDIYGVFADKAAICGGIAKAFVYLCNRVGIEAITITGDADNVPHMWDMVRIDRKWYHIDPTYAIAETRGIPYARYDYMCVTDEVVARTRVIYEQNYKYPEAFSEECNYYVKNGLVANGWEEVQEMLTERVLAASAERALFAEIQCGDRETFDDASYKLFDRSQAQVLKLLDNAYEKAENKYLYNNVSFNEDAGTYVIRVFLVYSDEE